MKNSILIASALAFLTLAGCQSVSLNSSIGPVAYSGESYADSVVEVDTTNMVKNYVSGLGCDAVEHINRKVFFMNPRMELRITFGVKRVG